MVKKPAGKNLYRSSFVRASFCTNVEDLWKVDGGQL